MVYTYHISLFTCIQIYIFTQHLCIHIFGSICIWKYVQRRVWRYIYILYFFHVHKHPWFWLFTYRHTCVDQGSCGAVFEPIFLENLRRLVESPMGVFVDGTKSVQTKLETNKNYVSRLIWLKVSTWWYRNIVDFYNSIRWCSRRSCRNGGFKICERPWRRNNPIESPCLVTELLLRRLALDSKILLQNPMNTV